MASGRNYQIAANQLFADAVSGQHFWAMLNVSIVCGRCGNNVGTWPADTTTRCELCGNTNLRAVSSPSDIAFWYGDRRIYPRPGGGFTIDVVEFPGMRQRYLRQLEVRMFGTPQTPQ